jgi:D-sedoheptulose 7-phosphate isomerase
LTREKAITTHSTNYLDETIQIANAIDHNTIEQMVQELVQLRFRSGRLFIIGLGGSAANASHAVNDFRKLCNIDASCPMDNVAELTARANDEGWDTCLELLFATPNDALLVLSVGGGTDQVSLPITSVLRMSKERGIQILGIVGKDNGYTATLGDCVVIVPTVNTDRVTPHTEGWQSVILHCIVSHPDLQVRKTKW